MPQSLSGNPVTVTVVSVVLVVVVLDEVVVSLEVAVAVEVKTVVEVTVVDGVVVGGGLDVTKDVEVDDPEGDGFTVLIVSDLNFPVSLSRKACNSDP